LAASLAEYQAQAWWWDSQRSRMTAFLWRDSLIWAEVELQNLSIVTTLANLTEFRHAAETVLLLAYDELRWAVWFECRIADTASFLYASDTLSLKTSGPRHADYRNMSLISLDAATGAVVSYIPDEKSKVPGSLSVMISPLSCG
jgi:hypothetical protein